MEEAKKTYSQILNSKLKSNSFTSEQTFEQIEDEARNEVFDKALNCYKGDEKDFQKFKSDLEFQINDIKKKVQTYLNKKNEAIIKTTKLSFQTCLKEYEESMLKNIESITRVELLEQCHKEIIPLIIQKFEKKCIVKNSEFLNPYQKDLHNELNKKFDHIVSKFNQQTEETNNLYTQIVRDAMKTCFSVRFKDLDKKSRI